MTLIDYLATFEADVDLAAAIQRAGISGDFTVGGHSVVLGVITSEGDIRSLSSVATGLDANGNSAFQFNYDNGLAGIIYYDNAETDPLKRLKFDATEAAEGYILQHSGNFAGYDKAEFVQVSSGVSDAGKPLVLDGNGLIDVSMIAASSFYPVGPWDPSAGTEYPDPASEAHGAFWFVDVLSLPTETDPEIIYTFTGGELIGLSIRVGDFMVWGSGGWGIMAGEMNPSLYYLLDGSQALTGNLAGGGFKIVNIAAAAANGEGVEYAQWIAANGTQDTAIALNTAKVTGGDRVLKAGDTMTGTLTVPTLGVSESLVSINSNQIEGNARITLNKEDGTQRGMFMITNKGETGSEVSLSRIEDDGSTTHSLIKLNEDDLYYYNLQMGGSFKVWHQENGGAGSGLDADLLDGYHANEFPLQTELFNPLNGLLIDTGYDIGTNQMVHITIRGNGYISNKNLFTDIEFYNYVGSGEGPVIANSHAIQLGTEFDINIFFNQDTNTACLWIPRINNTSYNVTCCEAMSGTYTSVQMTDTTKPTNITGEVTVIPARYAEQTKGEIKLYTGKLTDIPQGWHIANGTKGTVDMSADFKTYGTTEVVYIQYTGEK